MERGRLLMKGAQGRRAPFKERGSGEESTFYGKGLRGGEHLLRKEAQGWRAPFKERGSGEESNF